MNNKDYNYIHTNYTNYTNYNFLISQKIKQQNGTRLWISTLNNWRRFHSIVLIEVTVDVIFVASSAYIPVEMSRDTQGRFDVTVASVPCESFRFLYTEEQVSKTYTLDFRFEN